jgi:hypothetical protein
MILARGGAVLFLPSRWACKKCLRLSVVPAPFCPRRKFWRKKFTTIRSYSSSSFVQFQLMLRPVMSTRTDAHLEVYILLHPPILFSSTNNLSFSHLFFLSSWTFCPALSDPAKAPVVAKALSPALCSTCHSPQKVRVQTMLPLASNRLESWIRI